MVMARGETLWNNIVGCRSVVSQNAVLKYIWGKFWTLCTHPPPVPCYLVHPPLVSIYLYPLTCPYPSLLHPSSPNSKHKQTYKFCPHVNFLSYPLYSWLCPSCAKDFEYFKIYKLFQFVIWPNETLLVDSDRMDIYRILINFNSVKRYQVISFNGSSPKN